MEARVCLPPHVTHILYIRYSRHLSNLLFLLHSCRQLQGVSAVFPQPVTSSLTSSFRRGGPASPLFSTVGTAGRSATGSNNTSNPPNLPPLSSRANTLSPPRSCSSQPMLGQTTTPLALRPNETKIHFFSQYPQTATSRCPKGDGTPSPPSIVSSQSPLASEIHRVSNEETPSLPPATSSADRMLASSRAVAYASAGLGKMGQDISALNSLMDTVLNEEGTWSSLTKEDKKEANGVLDAWTPLNNGREKILPTSELTEGEYIARMKKVLYRIMSKYSEWNS